MDDKKGQENFLEDLKKQAEAYFKLRYDLIRLELGEKAAKISAALFSTLVLLFLFFFAVLFLSLMAGFYFSRLLQDPFKGFGVIAAAYVLIFILAFAFRKKLLELPVMNRMIRLIFNDNAE